MRLARAAQESIEPILRHEELEKQKEQPVERGRANGLRGIIRARRLAADTGSDLAHLEAALPECGEALQRGGGQRLDHPAALEVATIRVVAGRL